MNHRWSRCLGGVRILALVLLLAIVGTFQPCAAQEAQEAPLFFPVWIGDDSGKLSDEEAASLVADFAKQYPNPKQIVVWIHGFDNTRAGSTEDYNTATARLKESFQELGQDVAVVGIQWNSSAGGFIFSLPGEYDRKTLLARRVGRNGARTFLLALQEKFPQTDMNIFAHSMGCEVAMAADRPKIDFDKQEEEDGIEAYKPDTELRLHSTALLGADLDYDLAAKSRLPLRTSPVKLFWLTESSAFRAEHRDIILSLRAFVAGKALGATFPMMTEQQYDGLLGSQTIVFDNRDVPRTHHFILYYSAERIDRLVRGLLTKAGVKVVPPPELLEMQEVMDAPDSVESLKPFLDSELLVGKIYAIWRLEHHFGSGSSNLANGYLQSVASTLVHQPRMVRHMRTNSPSQTVRDGLWPTPRNLARAGDPEWASSAGNVDTKNFRGQVTAIEDRVLRITTEFGDPRYFDLERTRVTPSMAGVRVGSFVKVKSRLKRALEIEVIPYSVWINSGLPIIEN